MKSDARSATENIACVHPISARLVLEHVRSHMPRLPQSLVRLSFLLSYFPLLHPSISFALRTCTAISLSFTCSYLLSPVLTCTQLLSTALTCTRLEKTARFDGRWSSVKRRRPSTLGRLLSLQLQRVGRLSSFNRASSRFCEGAQCTLCTLRSPGSEKHPER